LDYEPGGRRQCRSIIPVSGSPTTQFRPILQIRGHRILPGWNPGDRHQFRCSCGRHRLVESHTKTQRHKDTKGYEEGKEGSTPKRKDGLSWILDGNTEPFFVALWLCGFVALCEKNTWRLLYLCGSNHAAGSRMICPASHGLFMPPCLRVSVRALNVHRMRFGTPGGYPQ